jgi:hypothetical protein
VTEVRIKVGTARSSVVFRAERIQMRQRLGALDATGVRR